MKKPILRYLPGAKWQMDKVSDSLAIRSARYFSHELAKSKTELKGE